MKSIISLFRRTIPAFMAFLFVVFSLDHSIGQETTESEILVLEDFELDSLGQLPTRWYNQKGDNQPFTYRGELRDKYDYAIWTEDGNKFLRYDGRNAKHLNFPLVERKSINIYETPILSWKWRIYDLPDGAREDNEELNDTAASIYVAFDLGRVALFKKVPKSIRYTWSSSLPVGKEFEKFFGNQKVVVVASGEDEKGKWVQFERNLIEDYRRLFGDKPPKRPLAILILSDANNTNSRAKADYDDLILKAAPSE